MADYQGRGRGGGRGGDRGGRGGDRGRGGRGGGGGGDRGGRGGSGDRGGRGGGGGYRGDGGGYRGGDRGGRGGGGGYRGDGGGYRGDGGGYRGGDRGGRGGRGGERGSATFSGFQGGRGDGGRGRGRGRGGPGGFGGRPDKFAGEAEVYSIGPQVPQPSADIHNLEDKLIKDSGVGALTSKVAKLQVSSTSPGNVTDENWFPRRPAYGTKGTKVVLWANYFALEASSQVPLLKYVLEVTEKKKPQEDPKDGKGNQKGKGSKPGKGGKGKKDEGPKGMKLHAIIKAALDKVGTSVPYATEFKANVISLAPLNLPDNKIIEVLYVAEGRDDTYEVKFLEPTTVDIPALLSYLQTMHDPTGDSQYPKFAEAIDAISTITGYYARSNRDSAAIGRSRYFMMNIAPSEKFEMTEPELNRIFRGYFQSARPVTGRLILNANVAHGVFRPTGPVADLVKAFDGDLYGLNKTIGRLRARYKVFSDDKDPKKTRIVQKVMKGLASPGDGRSKRGGGGGDEQPPQVPRFGAGPREVKFYLGAPAPAGLQANAFCSVADYYKKRYGYNVNPDLPVVAFGAARVIYVPAELIEIIDGQPLPRKLTADETRDMIEFACRSPFANATSIATYGRQILGLDKTEHLNKFGIKVGKTLLTVHGRELAPPSVVYQDERGSKQKTIFARDGSWNMVNVRVFKPGQPMNSWFWISIEKEGNYAHNNYEEVKSGVASWIEFMRKNMGIPISDRPLPCSNNKVTVPRNQKATAALRRVFEEMKPRNPQFVFVVLPGRKTDTEIYNEVKKLCDVEYGYLSQNVLWANLRKGSLQLYANLGLKVNLKMGGINHKLTKDIPIVNQNTMIVGYDVTHPTNIQDGDKLPSLVGMVSSVDSQLGQWPATAWAQTSRQEMLGDVLEARFRERLDLYRGRNGGKLPNNIVIYRDGVSEGQFHQVLQVELPLIRKACSGLYPPKSGLPKMSVIVSVKRHQTRFYPTDAGHMVKSRNIKDGTVVDRGVTLANTWDFFLTAHSGLQGTSRPAHYTVLLDEIFRAKYTKQEAADELEKLTYEMCYLFGRATKAVSICPPAYYADILCTRARVYLSDMFDRASAMSDTQSVVSSATGTAASAASDSPSVKVHDRIKNSMFYI